MEKGGCFNLQIDISGVTAGRAGGHSAPPDTAQRENQPAEREKRGVVKKIKKKGEGE